MQYRPFCTTGIQVSALGFGAMWLPLRGPGAGDIDEPLATRMLRAAIDAGVNYVDTA
jgi:predicted aldo/keto reductase-like oxidoreductase